ncbi:brachyurin-like [Neocloeon triangulifer]|uniref:brachyurin-like n=1 Tax=Neocloeon triangulifer TaxID=2078957 RepID=UPI00286F934E|nr:brachyurin-like [Neocloeon triangulifer]
MNEFRWIFCAIWLIVPVIRTSIAGKGGDRIVGGQGATRGQFPWMAVITSEINGVVQLYCGGSMISGDYVITAAQCVPPENDLSAKIRVVLGVHNVSLTSGSEIGRVDLIADYHFVHPGYNPTTLANDIAIVHLPTRVSSSPYIDPSRLPYASEATETYQGIRTRVSGWGASRDGGLSTHSDVLQFVDNNVMELQFCRDYYPNFDVTDKHICIYPEGGRGPCHGDEGSPLTLTEPTSEAHQIGIFSFGDPTYCTRGKPVVYTKLASHWDFITDYTGIRPQP